MDINFKGDLQRINLQPGACLVSPMGANHY